MGEGPAVKLSSFGGVGTTGEALRFFVVGSLESMTEAGGTDEAAALATTEWRTDTAAAPTDTTASATISRRCTGSFTVIDILFIGPLNYT